MTGNVLPSEFQDLSELVCDWAHGTEQARNEFRVSRSMNELQNYYDRLMPRLEEISAYLDNYDLNKLAREHGNLLELALMAMEVAPAIEYYNNPDVPESVEYAKFRIFPVKPKYFVVADGNA